jgi:hypothetical protein
VQVHFIPWLLVVYERFCTSICFPARHAKKGYSVPADVQICFLINAIVHSVEFLYGNQRILSSQFVMLLKVSLSHHSAIRYLYCSEFLAQQLPIESWWEKPKLLQNYRPIKADKRIHFGAKKIYASSFKSIS